MENQLEVQKKITTLQAQIDVRQTYDPENINPDAIQAQMNEYASQIGASLEAINRNQQARIAHEKLKLQLKNDLDTVLARYSNSGARQAANENLIKLIANKTSEKLPDDMMDYDSANMEKGIDFINMIGKLTPDLLLDSEMLEGFVRGDEFKNFEWNVVEDVL